MLWLTLVPLIRVSVNHVFNLSLSPTFQFNSRPFSLISNLRMWSSDLRCSRRPSLALPLNIHIYSCQVFLTDMTVDVSLAIWSIIVLKLSPNTNWCRMGSKLQLLDGNVKLFKVWVCMFRTIYKAWTPVIQHDSSESSSSLSWIDLVWVFHCTSNCRHIHQWLLSHLNILPLCYPLGLFVQIH